MLLLSIHVTSRNPQVLNSQELWHRDGAMVTGRFQVTPW